MIILIAKHYYILLNCSTRT